MTQDAHITWSYEQVIEHTKHALTSLPCGWANCKTNLNSWYKRSKHLHHHCRSDAYYPDTELYHCRFTHCIHNSFISVEDLSTHIETAHASPLPCPVSGCNLSFTHTQRLLDHLQHTHFNSTPSGSSTSPKLSATSHPQPYQLNPLPLTAFSDSQRAMPAWVVVTPPVMPHPDCQPSLSQTVSTKHTKVWRHLEHISEIQDEDDEDEEMPIHLEPPLINPYEALSSFSHFIVQPKTTLSADTALSGPVVLPSRGGQPPNVPHPEPTMGYDVFKKKYTELQIAGLLDGSGIWVQDEAENYLDPEP